MARVPREHAIAAIGWEDHQPSPIPQTAIETPVCADASGTGVNRISLVLLDQVAAGYPCGCDSVNLMGQPAAGRKRNSTSRTQFIANTPSQTFPSLTQTALPQKRREMKSSKKSARAIGVVRAGITRDGTRRGDPGTYVEDGMRWLARCR